MSIIEMILLFFFYSFVGWCVEVAFVAINSNKVMNRGFLFGPVCPIYGVGMVGVILLLKPVINNPLLIFLGGMIICSVVEFLGGLILDRIFHMRWWDYSDKPFNLLGYIWLGFCIVWGLGVLFVLKLINPGVEKIVSVMPLWLKIAIISFCGVIFIIDFIVTVKNLLGIKRSLGELEILTDKLEEIGDGIKDTLGNSAIEIANAAEQQNETIKKKIGETKESIEQKREELLLKREEISSNIKMRKYISRLSIRTEGNNMNILDYLKGFNHKEQEKNK